MIDILFEKSITMHRCNSCGNIFGEPIDGEQCPVCGKFNDFNIVDVESDISSGFHDRDSDIIKRSMQASEIMKKHPRAGYYYVIPLIEYGFDKKSIKYLAIEKRKRYPASIRYATIFNSYAEANDYIEKALHGVTGYVYGDPVKVLLSYIDTENGLDYWIEKK